MDAVENEIRENYKRMGVPLAEAASPFMGVGFESLSQYGYTMNIGFATMEAAEADAVAYYRDHMNLIRQ